MAPRQSVQKVNWWHERLADWMIANPQASLKDATKVFDCSYQTLYIIKNSDAFRIYWDYRRRQVEAALTGASNEALGGLMNKAAAIADMAMDQLLEQLDSNGKAQSVGAPILAHDELRSTADVMLKKLGYGLPQKGGEAPVQQNNVNITVDANLLREAREKMLQITGVTPSPPAPPLLEHSPQKETATEEK